MIQLTADVPAEDSFILSQDALGFLATIERNTRDNRIALLSARAALQSRFDAGFRPDFLDATLAIREGSWRVENTPPDYDEGMYAYSTTQQREIAAEADGFRATKHQSFVGTGYFDAVQNVIMQGQSNTQALKDSTETQFR